MLNEWSLCHRIQGGSFGVVGTGTKLVGLVAVILSTKWCCGHLTWFGLDLIVNCPDAVSALTRLGFLSRASRKIEGGALMPTKLYVGNLAYSVTNEDLEGLFSQAGKVDSAVVVVDKFSGQSRGFGFVEMADSNDAARAIEEFNDTELKGRNIRVNEARPREGGPGGGGGGPRGGGGGRDRRGGGGGRNGGGGGGGNRRW